MKKACRHKKNRMQHTMPHAVSGYIKAYLVRIGLHPEKTAKKPPLAGFITLSLCKRADSHPAPLA